MSVLTKSMSDIKFDIFKILLEKEKRNLSSKIIIEEIITTSLLISEMFLESCSEDRESLYSYLHNYNLLLEKRSLTRKELEELKHGNE
jgi:hypothetical protein